MTLERLTKHLENYHDLYDGVDETLEEWLRADEEWQDLMKTHPPNPHPCDYDSEKGEREREIYFNQKYFGLLAILTVVVI